MLHVALLRAVNLGPHNKVGMAPLRELAADVGLTDVRSVLQSGNLVFGSEARTSAALERLLEGAAKKHLRLETDVFVRTAKEWKAIVAGNPFADAAEHDPSHLVVLVTKDAPGRASVTALKSAIVGRETVVAQGRHLYITYPDGIGDSKLTTALLEKRLGTRGTARNWNTVLKLAALVQG